jgi:hypothetical protein
MAHYDVTLGETEKDIRDRLGAPAKGSQTADGSGPITKLHYGRHRSRGVYELNITIRNGIVVDVDDRRGSSVSTPGPPPAVDVAAPQIQRQASTGSGAGKVGVIVLALAALGGGAWLYLGASDDHKPEPSQPRPSVPPPSPTGARPKIPRP